MALTPTDITIPFHMDISVQAQKYLNDLVTWRPPDSLVNVLGLFGSVVLIYLVAYLLLRKPPKVVEKQAMTAPAREAYVKMAISDAVTEAVETLLDQDAITREEAMIWYRRISNAGLPDLLPKGQQLLKAALKAKRTKEAPVSNIIPMKKVVGQFLKRK